MFGRGNIKTEGVKIGAGCGNTPPPLPSVERGPDVLGSEGLRTY
jgi:hypothetical protein